MFETFGRNPGVWGGEKSVKKSALNINLRIESMLMYAKQSMVSNSARVVWQSSEIIFPLIPVAMNETLFRGFPDSSVGYRNSKSSPSSPNNDLATDRPRLQAINPPAVIEEGSLILEFSRQVNALATKFNEK